MCFTDFIDSAGMFVLGRVTSDNGKVMNLVLRNRPIKLSPRNECQSESQPQPGSNPDRPKTIPTC